MSEDENKCSYCHHELGEDDKPVYRDGMLQVLKDGQICLDTSDLVFCDIPCSLQYLTKENGIRFHFQDDKDCPREGLYCRECPQFDPSDCTCANSIYWVFRDGTAAILKFSPKDKTERTQRKALMFEMAKEFQNYLFWDANWQGRFGCQNKEEVTVAGILPIMDKLGITGLTDKEIHAFCSMVKTHYDLVRKSKKEKEPADPRDCLDQIRVPIEMDYRYWAIFVQLMNISNQINKINNHEEGHTGQILSSLWFFDVEMDSQTRISRMIEAFYDLIQKIVVHFYIDNNNRSEFIEKGLTDMHELRCAIETTMFLVMNAYRSLIQAYNLIVPDDKKRQDVVAMFKGVLDPQGKIQINPDASWQILQVKSNPSPAEPVGLKPCPYDFDTCTTCPRLYYFVDGKRQFDRQCRRYPSLESQKEEIRKKFPNQQIQFEGEAGDTQ